MKIHSLFRGIFMISAPTLISYNWFHIPHSLLRLQNYFLYVKKYIFVEQRFIGIFWNILLRHNLFHTERSTILKCLEIGHFWSFRKLVDSFRNMPHLSEYWKNILDNYHLDPLITKKWSMLHFKMRLLYIVPSLCYT